MSERNRNRSAGQMCIGIGAVLLVLALTNVPGSTVAIPIGVVMMTIGVFLVLRRKTQ